ncbi:MAG: protein-methionine-sulfoxide reductase heme-binding subunit MsrQ [Candidatus Competibacteraceae bacterium]|jgi:sulfoxide reductase heme-binding subunit YedZ|nr:protein-methionine-sulfoxide reductase heme-binding subunit MsrQ [Candidatus Competibacteraceae bacterium]
MPVRQHTLIRWIGKPLVFILSLLPLLGLFWQGLGVNPVETLTHHTGEWGLRLLLITLAITPLRGITGWCWLLRFRRMLGLFAFFYVVLHFATYLVFDQFFDLHAIVQDVLKRPYITVGFAAFLLLIPLAATSTNAMMKRLGGRRWQRLHRLVYAISVLAVLHYLWLVKADLTEPLVYGAILALLLGYRVIYHYRSTVLKRWRLRAQVSPTVTG